MSHWHHSVVHIFDDEDNGVRVKFEEWHSEYMDEDFVGVTVYDGEGNERMHSGMTHMDICEKSAESLARILSADIMNEEL